MRYISPQISAVLLVIVFSLFGISACSAQDLQSAKKDLLRTDNTVALEASVDESVDDGKVSIKLGGKEYRIAYADTNSERQLGLMYRRKMCDDCGMLFKFENVRVASIWMKNTNIPLDLAYISEQGEIVDIKQLTPHDLTSVSSPSPVLYALEMNQGWFAKQNIRVGDKVQILP